MSENYFSVLNSINVNGHTEKKNGLTYLSWAWAVAEVMKQYPTMTYTIWKDEKNRPYIYDENLGYMVFTSVTIEGETKEMWLPVMDNANNAMKNVPYTKKTKYKEIEIAAATMFDINTAIMRCLVKNFALFGLGLYIYAGEDIPEESEEEKAKREEEEKIKREEEEKIKREEEEKAKREKEEKAKREKEEKAKREEEAKKPINSAQIKELTALLGKTETSGVDIINYVNKAYNVDITALNEITQMQYITIKEILEKKAKKQTK